jgi:hypothetical protein
MIDNRLEIEESAIKRPNRSDKLSNFKAPSEPTACKLTYKLRR